VSLDRGGRPVRAAVFQGDGVVSVVDRSDLSITTADEVLIGVEVNGLCGSDLRAFAVPPQMAYDQGVVVGHEFVGRVIEVGPAVTSVREGDRVTAIPNISCQALKASIVP
jgi:threonine dehydrogenase-like Zn-dependent dehydrogenase